MQEIKNPEELVPIPFQNIRYNYDLIDTIEMWGNELHDWIAATDGYKLFRRDRKGRRGEGVALYAKTRIDRTAIS